MKPVYLDYAAATPLDPAVLAVMEPFFSEVFYNPSALYSGARVVKKALDDARASAGRSLGASPSEITFTAGGSESANLAIKGVMEQFPGCGLVVSAVEHDAVMEPAKFYGAKIAPVDSKGMIKLTELEKLITNETVLVSVMYANNEVGTLQPIREVVALVAKIRKIRAKQGIELPVYVHTDACQAPQYLNINVAKLGVDLMTLNGGKLYGPKQSGILYHRVGVGLMPQILGGGQESGLRSGTENVAASVGFAKALELCLSRRRATSKHVSELAAYFAEMLETRFGATINGHRKQRLANNIHATFPGCDNERVLFSLDDQGIYAAAGSACSASSELASHVLLAMGLTEEQARSSLRFSLGRQTTKQELDQALKALEQALRA